MEESETGHNGNAPHGVLHRLAQEDGTQERGEEGLKKKESPTCIKGALADKIPVHTATPLLCLQDACPAYLKDSWRNSLELSLRLREAVQGVTKST